MSNDIKKSGVYGIFGQKYGNKLINSLTGCCDGQDCCDIKEIKYKELLDLINSNSLKQKQKYLITDFQTVTYIQFSGGGIGNEELNYGDIEPMIVEAVSKNKIATQIWSTLYPDDIITWTPIFQDKEWDAVLDYSTGVITSREDTIFKLKRDFDFRNVIFRRWETINGSGIYDSIFNTGFGYEDYPPFAPDSYNCSIESPLSISTTLGIPYWLDNTIGKLSTSLMEVLQAFGNNIEGYFDSNGIIYGLFYNKIAEDFIYNNCFSYSNNTVTLLDRNGGYFIGGNSGDLRLINNVVSGSIVNNVFDGEINRNFCAVIDGNVSTRPNCLIRENVGQEINHNEDFQTIESNMVSYINRNTGFNLTDNTGHQFNDNNAVSPLVTVNDCEFKIINTSTITGDINNNTFLTNIVGKSFTSTAGMQSSNPSITLWDTNDGDVEQTLTSGVLNYTPF